MKLIWKIVLPVIGSLIILAFMLIVPVIILDKSWWWFFGTLILIFIVGIIIGLIMFIIRLGKKSPTKIKLDVKSAKKRAVNEIKYDDDNPDNLKITHSKLERWGEKGSEQTPILIIDGKGTELKQRRVIIMNLNNPKQESTKLTDPSDENIERQVKLMAEHPPEEIREEKETRFEGGIPITRTVTRRPSYYEKKEEEEKKKIENVAGL